MNNEIVINKKASKIYTLLVLQITFPFIKICFLIYNLYKHLSKKTEGYIISFSRKIALATIIMLGISIVSIHHLN